MRRVTAFLAFLSIGGAYACSVESPSTASSQAELGENDPSDTCDGLPRLSNVKTPPGVCVGIAARDIPMARGIARLDGERFLVTAWKSGPGEDGEGAIWMLHHDRSGWAADRLTTDVSKPHGVVVTEDGAVYIGEPSRVIRFYPEDPGRKETLIDGLPGDGLHWATTLAYDSGYLYVNKGSGSDNCAIRDESGVHFVNPCPEEGSRAHLRRYEVAHPSSFTIIGAGLRNSVALTVHPQSHLLLQGENGQNDLNMANPPEELNVIGTPPNARRTDLAQAENRHYGWPYCWANAQPSPGYTGELGTLSGKPFTAEDCQRFTNSPAVLLPEHSAPLGMTYVTGNAFPFQGSLVVTYHGFAKTGHKLVVVDANEDGVPTGAPPRDLVWGWGGDPSSGAPMGKPVSVIEAPDGALLVTDDQNGMILRVTCDRERGGCEPQGQTRDTLPDDPGKEDRCRERDARLAAGPNPMAELSRDVIDSNCVSCHGNELARPGGIVLKACDDVGVAAWLRDSGWVVPGNPDQSRVLDAVELGMGALTSAQLGQLRAWIELGAPPP